MVEKNARKVTQIDVIKAGELYMEISLDMVVFVETAPLAQFTANFLYEPKSARSGSAPGRRWQIERIDPM